MILFFIFDELLAIIVDHGVFRKLLPFIFNNSRVLEGGIINLYVLLNIVCLYILLFYFKFSSQGRLERAKLCQVFREFRSFFGYL